MERTVETWRRKYDRTFTSIFKENIPEFVVSKVRHNVNKYLELKSFYLIGGDTIFTVVSHIP